MVIKNQIFWMKKPTILYDNNFQYLISILDSGELECFNTFNSNSKKIDFILGRVLIKTILGKILGICPEEVFLSENKYGKLYLLNCTRDKYIYFNLSHSGSIIALAISNKEVGIDVEFIEPKYLKAIHYILNKEEISFVNNQQKENMLKTYYTIWTRKEALFKAIGTGLFKNFKSILISTQKTSYKNWVLFSYYQIKNHILSVALKETFLKPEVSECTLEKLLNKELN